VLCVRPIYAKTTSWALGSKSENCGLGRLFVSLELDEKHIDRTVDRGPPAEDKPAAANFRQLWGQNAELRRFQDGSILESVVWSLDDSDLKPHQQIIECIVKRHLNLSVTFVTPNSVDQAALQFLGDHTVRRFGAAWQSCDDLQKLLQDMECMPLRVRQIQATGLNGAGSFDDPLRRIAMDLVIQFEGSARWPEDLVAIQKTKIAFIAKIGDMIERSPDKRYQAHIGLENHDNPCSNSAFLQVYLRRSNVTFKVRVFHDREMTLIRNRIDASTSSRERMYFAAAAALLNAKSVKSSPHMQSFRILCMRFPILIPTWLLVKRWFESHLMLSHFSEELYHLLVARVFVQPYPVKSPASAEVGFLRVLRFLAEWDWRSGPLLVDTEGDIELAQVELVQTRLEAWRRADPAFDRVTLIAATNYDLDGTTWTLNRPSKAAATRMTLLARAASRLVDGTNLGTKQPAIFSRGLVDFDFIIYLRDPCFIHGREGRPQSVYKNLQVDDTFKTKKDSNSAQGEHLVSDLHRIAGKSVDLFYDLTLEPVIAGVWRQQCNLRTRLRVGCEQTVEPVLSPVGKDGSEACVSINRDALLTDIARLGGDLIERIEVLRANK